MKRVVFYESNEYVVELTDEEYEELNNGAVSGYELLEEKKDNGNAEWKYGILDLKG